MFELLLRSLQVGGKHSLWKDRSVGVVALGAGVLLCLHGCAEPTSAAEWKAGLFFTLIGGWALWSMRHSRRTFLPLVPSFPDSEPERTEPTEPLVPTLYARPEAGAHCAVCGIELVETVNAF